MALFLKGKCLLQNILDKRNMTQTELAKRTKIPRLMIWKYIHNKAPIPIENAYSIMYVLDCRLGDLYEFPFNE